jgi:hypothetical protein
MKSVAVMVEAVSSMLGESNKSLLDSFPRNIEQIITFAPQIPVIRQTRLSLSSANQYLCALRGYSNMSSKTADDRKLKGLLYIGSPCAIIFISAGLPPDIEAYILAHELGHLLAEVFLIKQLWLKTLPERTEAIRKYFAWEEADPMLELRAFIKGLPLRPRPIVGRDQNYAPETTEREALADLFGREIIAPWSVIEPFYIPNSKREFAETVSARFNLPLRVAANYYDDLNLYLQTKPRLYDRLLSRLPH